MESKSKLLCIGEGVLRSTVLTLILVLVLGIVSNFYELSASIMSVCFVIVTTSSVIYGSIYSTKKIKQRGWIIGIVVAILYISIIYLVSLISGSRDFDINTTDIFRLALCSIVGCLSGMLGINL